MMEYIEMIYKCIIVYFVVIFALRLMGKREVGELSVFDVVIYLIISELSAISIAEEGVSIFKSLVPLTTLVILQILVSWVLLKSKKSRDMFDGKCKVIIHNGHINQEVMYKERYNIDDLMNQLRDRSIGCPDEVEFAILESSGNLSVLESKQCKVKHPCPLVSDGTINHETLKDLSLDEAWLKDALKKEGVDKVEDVFLCIIKKSGLYVVKKETDSRNTLF